MELVTVTITGQAITARYGTLNTGDVLRTDAAYARHLVEDCCAAQYAAAPQPVPVPAAKARKPRAPAAPVEGETQAEQAPGELQGQEPDSATTTTDQPSA